MTLGKHFNPMQISSPVARYCLLIILSFCQFAMAETNFTLSSEQQAARLGSGTLTETSFLAVDEAFELNGWIDPAGNVRLAWQIAQGYYLYRHRFEFSFSERPQIPLQPELTDGKRKQDEYFGDVEVYYHQASVTIPLEPGSSDNESAVVLEVGYQGCADAGLCYPPQTRRVSFSKGQAVVSNPEKSLPKTGGPVTEEQAYLQILASAGLLKIIGLFLIAGLALTFTPCVLPMIPIVSSIVLGQGEYPGRRRAFALSLTYVMAMAITYAIAGMLTGYFGAQFNLQMKMQSPLFLGAIAALFALLSLAMFGAWELRLPAFFQNHLQQISQRHTGGTYMGVALIGLISTLIVSPCVSAPLAGALVFISSTGNPLLGGLALLALGLGMGIPLLVIGTFGTEFMPRAGQWMNQVKVFFGVLLLGIAIWILDRVIPGPVSLLLWAALCIGYAIYLGALRRFSLKQPLQLAGLILLVYGTLLTAGAANRASNPLTPLANLRASDNPQNDNILSQFQPVSTIGELDKILAKAGASGTPVMLDIYADWCISCQVLEHQVFVQPEVSAQLQKFILTRIDVTKNTAQHQAFLKQFGLFGPPGLLFFAPDASEMRQYRIQGEVSASQLTAHLSSLLDQI